MQKWVHFLQTCQEEFIQRMEVCLHPDEQHLYGFFKEQIYISEELSLKKIRDFARKKVKFKPENNFLGKLGEAAVKKYVRDTLLSDKDGSDRLSPLDCKVYKDGKGDGGKDFCSKVSDINVYLQIKTTRLKTHRNSIRALKWRLNKTEVDNNRVLVCTFVYQNIELNKASYYVIIAGFLPREVVIERIRNKTLQYVKKKDNPSDLQLTIQYLMHPIGLLPYLFEPEIEKVHKQSSSVTQADKLGVFYLRCGFYQEALEQTKISLQFQPASYDALLNKSACFFAFAQDQIYNLHQKQVLYPSDEDTLQQELELIYGDCLEWDDDLSQFIQEQHRQLYPGTSKAPQRITSPYGGDDYLYWQVIKDTSLAISIDATRPEAYVNRALAYEQLSLRRGMPNLKLAGCAIWNHTQAISCSAKK